jgi:hypothetical protein
VQADNTLQRAGESAAAYAKTKTQFKPADRPKEKR